jgi:hypothetical protein
MKKGMIIIIILIFLIQGVRNADYTKTAKVFSITDTEVSVIDRKGEIWSFYGTGFTEGEKVTLHMKSNGTFNFKDDIIFEVE